MKERTEAEYRKLFEFFARSWNSGQKLDKKIAELKILRNNDSGKRRAALIAVDPNRTVVGYGNTRLDALIDLWVNVLSFYGKAALHVERQFDELRN